MYTFLTTDFVLNNLNQPQFKKTNLLICPLNEGTNQTDNEDSDQPAHLRRLIRVIVCPHEETLHLGYS